MTFASPRNARSVYLVTYSQANLEIVPSRTDFATLVKDAFENTGGHNTLVQQWCCCREEHQDGNPHYIPCCNQIKHAEKMVLCAQIYCRKIQHASQFL